MKSIICHDPPTFPAPPKPPSMHYQCDISLLQYHTYLTSSLNQGHIKMLGQRNFYLFLSISSLYLHYYNNSV